MPPRFILLILAFLQLPLFGQTRYARYALVLSDAPVARSVSSRQRLQDVTAEAHRQRIETAQAALRGELELRQFQVTGAAQSLLNVVWVTAPVDREGELRSLPGVEGIVRVRRQRPLLDRAVPLVNGPAAWSAVGGVDNAGRGIKIAILDTGIDQGHPGFQDPALAAPGGFPKCQVRECDFTNNKVIAARSYVSILAAGAPPGPEQSHPDDLTPRDRIGHGTAVAMTAAGETNTGPAATITGMAPKAYLGNYKVFGSPEVNGFTTDEVIIRALEDAFNDGMDIASLSLGGSALTGPLDQGADCGNTGNTPCDLEAAAIENAVRMGMIVVSAAGNEGDIGLRVPTAGTIDSPGYTPSAISVGAIANSHTFSNSVRVPGNDVPANLQRLNADFGDGPLPPAPLTAPLRDVTSTGNDGRACTPLRNGSLTGTIALVLRGDCTFAAKVNNLQNAGAIGAIFIQTQGTETTFPPGGLIGTNIPTVLIGSTDGQNLKSFLASHPDHPASLDPTLSAIDSGLSNVVVDFSSRGPATGTSGLKPDLVAVGTDMYMATEKFDPFGDLYSADGYTVASGTSFSTPMVAGAAALVKQAHPNFTAGQVKSALVNTAATDLTDTSGRAASVTAIGGGRLDAGAAVRSTVTVEPAALSFGAVTSTSLPNRQTLHITNTGTNALNLAVSVQPRDTDPARVTVSSSTLSLAPGQAADVTTELAGAPSSPGSFEGTLLLQSNNVSVHVPYLYAAGDNTAFNALALLGDFFDGTANESTPEGFIALRVVDRFGLPVAGLPVDFSVTQGGGRLVDPDPTTDKNGIAFAGAVLGPSPGDQEFTARAGGLTVRFDGFARPKPTISANGVVNAASFEAGRPVAPGSYVSIFGSGLSDDTAAANRAVLPLGLDGVSISFDVPSAGLSLPGRIYYVSPNQVNVQVPWELRGQSSALMKVNVVDSVGTVFTVPLADYSPGVFEYNQSASSRLAAALDSSGRAISTSNPAQRGSTIQVYANGLGPVDSAPPTGEPAANGVLPRTVSSPTVTIGGRPAAVSFSGLAPGFSGLYQLNVAVPADAATGVQPLVVTINGAASKTVNLPVQ